jgi:hypothetical protein
MMTNYYKSIKDVSKETGIGRTTILYRVRENNGAFPQPDAVITHDRTVTYGWLPETIEEYNTNKKEN